MHYFTCKTAHHAYANVAGVLDRHDLDIDRRDWQEIDALHEAQVRCNDRGRDVGYDFEIAFRGPQSEELATELQQRLVGPYMCSVVHY